MKKLFKRPRTYILLMIMVLSVIGGSFLYDYYEVYTLAKNPPSVEAADYVENPFDEFEDIDPDGDSNASENSYEQIAGIYKGKFANLQAQQEAQIDKLVKEARTEYENGASKMQLGAKYLNIANNVEAQAEKDFKQLKEEFKNDLARNSHDTSLVNELDSYYVYQKQSIKSEILAKIQGNM